METKATSTLKALRVNEHGHPIKGGVAYDVTHGFGSASVFHGDYLIVTRNAERVLVAIGVYPTFQRVSQEITALRERSTATHFNVMEVA